MSEETKQPAEETPEEPQEAPQEEASPRGGEGAR